MWPTYSHSIMITGEFRRWNRLWEDKTIKVEKSHHASDRHDDDTETNPVIIDITLEDESESESDTEESCYAFYPEDSELYAWGDDEITVTPHGEVEITLRRVKANVLGYNRKGKIQEVKPKPRIIKIV